MLEPWPFRTRRGRTPDSSCACAAAFPDRRASPPVPAAPRDSGRLSTSGSNTSPARRSSASPLGLRNRIRLRPVWQLPVRRAILEAAWAELAERGYSGLTMEAVAERAGTSRPVLARRWDGKAPLAIAAIRQQMTKHPLKVSDQGNLRAELLEFLERASDRASGIAAAFTLFSSGYFTESSSVPKDLRAALIQGEVQPLSAILERAVKRGEVDPKGLIPPVASLLSDLFRHHVIMNFSAPPPALRKVWVDAMFLPLVRAK
ncbi:TetR/AcrR family transcriptional regulator [Tardiphaga sp. P9-11]|nr:TetR/AcrR family transcriptional regulator [Tardiphaga sp. P9-11]